MWFVNWFFPPSRLWIKPFNYWCADVSNPFECCMWCRPLSSGGLFLFPSLLFSPTMWHGNRVMDRWSGRKLSQNDNYKWITQAILRIKENWKDREKQMERWGMEKNRERGDLSAVMLQIACRDISANRSKAPEKVGGA